MSLILKNVSKTFVGKKAVDNISLTLEKPGVYGLLGTNGAGKTTTIRMLLGIIKKDSGEISWNGKTVDRKNVNFGYRKDHMVIKNMNLEIPAFKTTAIVGESGAGKTSVFNMITKLYRINSGKITIDGIDMDELTEESLRGNISLITQNPYIFNFSVKENFQIVKKNVTMKEIEEVCKKACIHDYIMSLPEKYDTQLGEGGVTLSGG